MLVVEKSLDRIGGHQTTQVFAIQHLVGDRSLTFITGRQCQLSVDDASLILPVLSTREEIKNFPKRSVSHDINAMRHILSCKNVLKHEAVLYATAQDYDLRVALGLVSESPCSQQLYMRILLDREIAQLTYDERTALRSAIGAGRIILLTETESLAVHFLNHYDLPCHQTALCLPCNFTPAPSQVYLGSKPFSETRSFRVGVLGGWRAEKGAKILPELIRHLRHALDAAHDAPKVELIIQKKRSQKIFKSITKDVMLDYEFLRSTGWPKSKKRISLSFRPTGLSTDDFKATLMSVDLLLVPYRLDEYRHRGSGIILDAVAARKPIVYTDGMGMTEFLRHGNAEAASEDPADYASKVISVLADIEAYRQGADRAALEFEKRIERAAILLRSI